MAFFMLFYGDLILQVGNIQCFLFIIMEIKNDTNESPSNNELLQSQFLMRSASPRN